MKKTCIVSDSHSSLTQEEAKKLGVRILSMPFYMNGTCYYEGKNISYAELLGHLRNMEEITTSQPSPAEVMELWDETLQEYEEIVYIPISSGLSGSCMAAMALAQEDAYAGRVYVVDNGRVATPLHRSILDAIELLREGCNAAEIKERLEAARDKMGIYVTVENLQYLKRGGRVSASAAMLGDLLNVKPVLYFDTGALDVYKKCRGRKKAKAEMIAAVKHVFETEYAKECECGDMYLLAASSADPEETDQWVEEIRTAFPGMEVLCDPLSFGVTCHIGPGGLGIGYSCRP